jgi:hypothetical protein
MIFGIPTVYFFIAIGFLVCAMFIYVLWNYKSTDVAKKGDPFNAPQFIPVIEKLEKGLIPPEEILMKLAQNIDTRYHLFHILKSYQQTDYFPKHYYTIAHASESYLANWLQYYSIKQAKPHHVNFLGEVKREGIKGRNNEYYRVYSFMLHNQKGANIPPFIGVVGPFGDDVKPYDLAHGTNSRFKTTSETSLKDEVDWADQKLSSI